MSWVWLTKGLAKQEKNVQISFTRYKFELD